MIETATPVVVLSLQSYGSLGIVRSLGRLGVPVYAVDGNPRRPAATSRYLRGRFVHDLSGASPEENVDALLRVARRLERRAVLIPTWDETAILAAESYAALAERFILPKQPTDLPTSLADKGRMFAVAQRHGVPTPAVTLPKSVADVAEFAASSAFPVVLKGIDGARLKRRTGVKMAIVSTGPELLRLYGEMEDPAQPNLMLQEYIPGGDDTIWMFNGYFDSASECLFGITGRKIRQTPPHVGVTSLGICEPNPTVDATTRRWMREIGYRGILDIGYRFDARDGQYKVLDVNPRIGATFRLFVDAGGLDVVRALYLDLTGQPVPTSIPVRGRKWLVEGADVDSFLRYRHEGTLTTTAWLRSLAGVQESAYFARDDLRPFLMECAEFARRLIRGRRSG
jgi:predicted ATP-grasp superfamily ATP-dependent carboligase